MGAGPLPHLAFGGGGGGSFLSPIILLKEMGNIDLSICFLPPSVIRRPCVQFQQRGRFSMLSYGHSPFHPAGAPLGQAPFKTARS